MRASYIRGCVRGGSQSARDAVGASHTHDRDPPGFVNHRVIGGGVCDIPGQTPFSWGTRDLAVLSQREHFPPVLCTPPDVPQLGTTAVESLPEVGDGRRDIISMVGSSLRCGLILTGPSYLPTTSTVRSAVDFPSGPTPTTISAVFCSTSVSLGCNRQNRFLTPTPLVALFFR